MKNSREKGKRFERKLAGMLRDAGYNDARRTAQVTGKDDGVPDVIGVPGIHVEAKHYGRGLSLVYDWMAQAVRDSRNGNLPTVFCKQDNGDVLVVMRFDDWITATREYVMEVMEDESNSNHGQGHI